MTTDLERGRSSKRCDVITRVLHRKEGGGKVREVTAEAKVRLRRGPRTKEGEYSLEAGKGMGMGSPLESPEGTRPLQTHLRL